jgi:hypothetical protein
MIYAYGLFHLQCQIDLIYLHVNSTVHNLSVLMVPCCHVFTLQVSFDRDHKLLLFLELKDYGEEASLARMSKWPFLTPVFGLTILTFAILRYYYYI